MVMGGEEGFGSDLLDKDFCYRLGDCLAVRGTGATSYFVKNHQTSVGRMAQNIGRLHHLHHECRESASEKVGCTHPGEDTVHYANSCGFSGQETANLRQDHKESGLTYIGTF